MTSASPSDPAADGPVSPADVDAVLAGTQVLGALIAESLAAVEHQVSMPQLRVLLLASREEPLNLGTVARDLGVHPSNATRTCDRLVKAGLLDRRTSRVDRRHLDLSLTAAGRRLVDAVIDHRRSRIEALLRRLPRRDREALGASLAALATAAADEADALTGG